MDDVNKSKYILFILLQSLIYGIGNPLTKIAYRSITPYWLLAGRYVFAAPIIVFLARKSLMKDVRSTDVKIWLPPCVCCAAAYITGNLALNYTTATPLGLLATGTAWGEWGAEEIAETASNGAPLGYTPSGLENGWSLEALMPVWTKKLRNGLLSSSLSSKQAERRLSSRLTAANCCPRQRMKQSYCNNQSLLWYYMYCRGDFL